MNRYGSEVAIFHKAIKNCFLGDILLRPHVDLINDGLIIFKIYSNVDRSILKRKKSILYITISQKIYFLYKYTE